MKRIVFACVALMLLFASACSAPKIEVPPGDYEIGGDIVPGIANLVGEKEQKDAPTTTTENKILKKTYSYKSDSVTQDLFTYLFALMEQHGYVPTADFDLNNPTGTASIGIASKDEGNVILVGVMYDEEGYSLTLMKLEGVLEDKNAPS